MASVKSFDLYTCKVCLENMLDKNPRLLSCHHSFCTDCLKSVIKGGSILCPTCRKSTTVPDNDINSLVVNFMLQEVKAHLDEVHSSKVQFCQLCLSERAVLKCQECIELLCEDCSLKHSKVKTFKDHKLFKLCPKHKESMITHLCMKCVQPSCSKCVMMEHLDHEADIEMFDDGMKIIKQTISQYETDITAKVQTIRNWKENDDEKLENVKRTISKVEGIREYYLRKVKETEDVLEILYKDRQKGQEQQKEYEIKMKEFMTVKHALQISQDINNDILDTFKSLKNEIKGILHETEGENLRFKPEKINIRHPETNENVNCKINEKQEIYFGKPELIKTIRCPWKHRWSSPWNLSKVDDDCVLICDWNIDFITMAHISNKPKVKIPAQYGCVRDACLFHDCLYTAYNNFITKRSFNNGATGPELKYNPYIYDINSMKVISESCVLLLSRSEKRITEFNPNNNHTKIVARNLQDPVHVNIMRSEGKVLYFVTCRETHSVDVYDEGWKLVRTFGRQGQADGQMRHPWRTTFTKQGILVADEFNHRICLYSIQGKFIKHILTRNDGISNPWGLLFTTPFLWLSHGGPSVKCYKLCQ